MHETIKKATDDPKADQTTKIKNMTDTINQYTIEIEKIKKPIRV